MMAADYRHIGGRENRLGRHYSRFSPFLPAPALASQSLALRKLCDAGSNRRRRANTDPSATLSSSTDFPGSPVIRSTLLRRFSRRDEEGFSSCLACPCHRAVASTPPSI